MNATITIDGTASMLAHISHRFGRVPEDSVVMLTVGPDGSLGAGLRILLTDRHDPDETAARIMQLGASTATESVFVAVYTPSRVRAEAFAGQLHERAAFLGIGLLASVHATAAGWERLDRPGQRGSAEQVRDSAVNAEMVSRGSVVRDAIPADATFAGPADAAARIAAVAPKSVAAAVAWFNALVGADRAVLPVDAYQLAAALSRSNEVRDRLVAATIGTGSEPMPELQALLLGRPGTTPDWSRASRSIEVLTDSLAHIPEGHRAGIQTALGWLAWLQGRGVAAKAWLTRAQQDEPKHRLAILLEQMVRREVAPIALDPETAYRPDNL